MKISKKFILLFLIFLLSGCINNFYTEGNLVFEHNIKKLKVGMSKSEIKKDWGPPTIDSNFGENILYYYYETSNRKIRFLNKKITDSKLFILTFNDQDILTSFKILTEKDRKNIPLDKEKTKIILRKKVKNYKKEKDFELLIPQ